MERRYILSDPRDNVVTLLENAESGDVLKLSDKEVVLLQDVPFAHKAALSDIPEGAGVFKYGERIGYALRGIKKGEWVHVHNLGCDTLKKGSYDPSGEKSMHGLASETAAKASRTTFMGYRRPDGRVGVRNYVAIIPSVLCADTAAKMIARQVPGCVARIRGGAFAGCGGLLHVSISEEVETIEEDAFANCASLLWIAVYGRNTAFANQDFCSDTIVYCYGDSLARETCEAMAHCKVMDLNRHSPGLFNVVKLPSNLMTIGGNAFSGINADVIVVPARTMALGDGAFSGIDSLEFVFIPAGVCDIGADVFAGSDGVWIVCEEGSEAEGFARENNIPIFDLEKWMKLIG